MPLLSYRTDEPLMGYTRRNRQGAVYGYPMPDYYRKGRVFDMGYEAFKARVNALIERSNAGICVRFSTDNEKGKHYANCSDGTTIIGNLSGLKVTVKWGSGHTSMAVI